MEKQLAALREELDEHDLILRGDGNGRKGLSARINTLEEGRAEMRTAVAELRTDVAKVGKAVEALAEERRSDNDRRAGAKSTVDWIRWSLQLLAIVVSLTIGFTQLQANFANVTQQLNRIPNLPE